MQFEGFIRDTASKSGKTKKGRDWTVYSASIVSADGKQNQRLSFGFEAPSVREGDYVKLDANEEGGFMVVDPSTIERVDPPKQEVKAQETNSSGGNYVDRQDSIVMQHSQEMAIQMVNLLLSHSALPVSAATNKAGHAKRFDEIKAAVDKFTVEFFNDVKTLRKLETVADSGVIDTGADSDLPNVADAESSGSSNPLDD